MRVAAVIFLVLLTSCFKEVKTDDVAHAASSASSVIDTTHAASSTATVVTGPSTTTTIEDQWNYGVADAADAISDHPGAASSTSVSVRPVPHPVVLIHRHTETVIVTGGATSTVAVGSTSAMEVHAAASSTADHHVVTDTVKTAGPGWRLYAVALLFVVILLIAGFIVIRYKLWRPGV